MIRPPRRRRTGRVSNLKTVQAIYEAFGRGDVPFILDQVADDVRWDHWDPPGPAHTGAVPYLSPRDGRSGVGAFFASLATANHLATNTA